MINKSPIKYTFSLTILQRLRVSVQPTDEWKPALRPPPGDVEMSKTLIFNGMT